MYCSNCGKELQDDWKKCPYCGTDTIQEHSTVEDGEIEQEQEIQQVYVTEPGEIQKKTFEIRATRRGGNFLRRDVFTTVEVNGNDIVASSGTLRKKEQKFHKNEVESISFNYQPIWWVSDYIRIIVFGLLMFLTYGLSAFAVVLSIYIACSNHLVIKLVNGVKVKIPVRQKCDATDLLEELGASKDVIVKSNEKKLSDSMWNIRYSIISIVLFVVAAFTIAIGINLSLENQANKEAEEMNVVTIEEAGGYAQWKEDGFPGKVRADIIVSLPIYARESNNYCVTLAPLKLDNIILMKEDIPAKDWDWLMNAQPYFEGGDEAHFEVTLSYVGWHDESNMPIFEVSDEVSSTISDDFEYNEQEGNGSDGQTETGIGVSENINYSGVYENSEDGTYLAIYQNGDVASFFHSDLEGYIQEQAYNCSIANSGTNKMYIDGTYWYIGQNEDGTLNMSSGVGGVWGHFSKVNELDEVNKQMFEEMNAAYDFVLGKTFHKIDYETQLCFASSTDFFIPTYESEEYHGYYFDPNYMEEYGKYFIRLVIDEEVYTFSYSNLYDGGFYLSGDGFFAGDYEPVNY